MPANLWFDAPLREGIWNNGFRRAEAAESFRYQLAACFERFGGTGKAGDDPARCYRVTQIVQLCGDFGGVHLGKAVDKFKLG